MIKQLSLFPEYDYEKGIIKTRSKIIKCNNIHLIENFDTEGAYDILKVHSYNGPLPSHIISYNDARCSKVGYMYGVHFYIDDTYFENFWHCPEASLSWLRLYQCVIAPDYSLFVDVPPSVNVMSIMRNRILTQAIDKFGGRAIPSASWGDVNSFKYCFDGLPLNSIIAIGHEAIGRDNAAKYLYRKAVETLIEKKKPTKLLVYGSPLDFSVGTEVVYYEGRIEKMRKMSERRGA